MTCPIWPRFSARFGLTLSRKLKIIAKANHGRGMVGGYRCPTHDGSEGAATGFLDGHMKRLPLLFIALNMGGKLK